MGAEMKGLNAKLAFAIIAAALGSAFQHGYNTGVINSPQSIMMQWVNETIKNRTDEYPTKEKVDLIWSIAAGIVCVGGMIGGSLIGFAADTFGRKGSLLLNNVLVVVTVIFESCSKAAGSFEMFIIGRFVIGINSGLNAGLAPMYLAEVSPVHLRGAVGTVYQLIVTISILVAQILSLQQILGSEEHWPVLFAMTLVPAIFQILTLFFCPETPKHLLFAKGKEMDARKALVWLRNTNDVHDEMDEMRTEYESVKLIPQVTVRELIMNSALRIPLMISVMIMIAQQFSGINAIMFFSTSIINKAGITGSNAEIATIVIGVVNVLVTVVSLFLVERAGRKTLLLIGFSGLLVVTILLTIAMSVNASGFISVFLLITFIVFFAIGPGSIPWFLVSELFSQSARPTATSIAIAVNWTANFIVTTGFTPIEAVLGPKVFAIFAVLLALFTLFIYKKVPETKNKTLEEISSMFRQISYQ